VFLGVDAMKYIAEILSINFTEIRSERYCRAIPMLYEPIYGCVILSLFSRKLVTTEKCRRMTNEKHLEAHCIVNPINQDG
jgi:hypothetical protein